MLTIATFADDTLPERFGASLPDLLRARGLLIDLSENGGGSTANARAVLRHLIDRTAPGSRWKTPNHVAAYAIWGRYGDTD